MAVDQGILFIGPRQSGLSSALASSHHYGWKVVGNVSIHELDSVFDAHTGQLAVTLHDPTKLTPQHLQALFAKIPQVQGVFLEAPLDTLVLRALQSDIPHYGLSDCQPSLEAVLKEELQTLTALKPLCAFSLNTNDMSVDSFRYKLGKILGDTRAIAPPMTLHLWSFGFKVGLPLEADWVLDARFLTNPFYEPDLRPLTGMDAAIQDYVMQFPEAQAFLNQTLTLLETTLPHYQQQGKERFILAIGCTGGKHRSVTMIEKLHQALLGNKQYPWPLFVYHREKASWLRPSVATIT